MGLFYTLLCLFDQCLNSPYNFTLYNNNAYNGTTKLQDLDCSLRTIFIVHGWQQSGHQPWVHQMKNAYLDNFSANVVVLDWAEDASALTYYPSVRKVPEVGRFLGQALYILYSKKFIRRLAGQLFAAKTNGSKIKSIVGLDAASSMFESLPEDRRLDAGDADFVQSFHSSHAGMKKAYATVDVYFNYRSLHGCGVKQPSCPSYPGVDVPLKSLFPIMFCNHLRAVAYFIQTITSKKFLGVLCTCKNFASAECNGTEPIVIGEHISLTSEPGEYFLSTSCELPFAMGFDGVVGGQSNYDC